MYITDHIKYINTIFFKYLIKTPLCCVASMFSILLKSKKPLTAKKKGTAKVTVRSGRKKVVITVKVR